MLLNGQKRNLNHAQALQLSLDNLIVFKEKQLLSIFTVMELCMIQPTKSLFVKLEGLLVLIIGLKKIVPNQQLLPLMGFQLNTGSMVQVKSLMLMAKF